MNSPVDSRGECEWVASPERPLAEESFHDDWASHVRPEDVRVLECFEACTSPENRYILSRLGDIRGKHVLDIGCGQGEASAYFALRGAKVVAVDISDGMLDLARRVAGRHNVTIETRKMPAEQLDFPDETFDLVYGANVLHHSDITKVLSHCSRILKPGGIAAFWDPIVHNPLIKVYRRIAAEVRTVDEHPLSMRDLRYFDRHFSQVEYRCFWLFSLWIFLHFFLIERVHPGKERYWKKIIVEHQRLERMYRPLERLDGYLLACLPFLKRWCWNVAVVARK
ncbi:MAG: methyltransferase domain-containing protein [Acidobacteria bacterium]|nr:methyltransferase domain-containing protein [Acidobacteriota bacterium]